MNAYVLLKTIQFNILIGTPLTAMGELHNLNSAEQKQPPEEYILYDSIYIKPQNR